MLLQGQHADSAANANPFAHLRLPAPQRTPNNGRPEPEGKRWLRRRENAKFADNPHIAPPTTLDFAHPLHVPSSTFPHPLPPYLPRTVNLPPSLPPPSLPSTSSAGLFSLSLRGARRTLRARPSSAPLVKALETHLAAWIQGGTYLNPDQAKGLLHFPGDPVGGREDIREVGREASRLVWAVKADPPRGGGGGFERYVVHCVARWYGVVSFSREMDGYRLTYLLRPNFTRPDPFAHTSSRTLDTPPTTDASDFHASDANLSDGSDYNATDASDIDSIAGARPTHSLSDIQESRPSSPASWSVIGGPDFAIDSDNDADERGFAASMESLSPSTRAESDNSAPPLADTTLTPSRLRNTTIIAQPESSADVAPEEQGENATPSRDRPDRDRLRTLYARSTSSPSPASRSPRRIPTARKMGGRRTRKAKNDKKGFARTAGSDKGSFYDYLFA